MRHHEHFFAVLMVIFMVTSLFTPDLNERFEKEVLAKLKGTGLKFDFEI